MRVASNVVPWSREFVRPLPLVAAGLMALNDHVLKGAGVLPGWVTGKLSDVTGLFFFPVLLFALVSAVRGSARGPGARTRRAALLAGLTALVFAAIKVLPPANAVANAVLGRVVLDPTDLLALPSAAASLLYLRRAPPGASGARLRVVADRVLVLLAAIASVATSGAPLQRSYPTWTVTGSVRADAGCATIAAEVVKSGKEGVGVVLKREGDGCDLVLTGATLHVGDVAQAPVAIPAWDGDGTTYLGFVFDNERAWNDGVRDGALEVVLRMPEGPRRLRFRLYHAYAGPWVPVPAPPRPEPAPLPMAVDPSTPMASDGGAP